MAFTQHIDDCQAHDACTEIRCQTDTDILDATGTVMHKAGTVVWHSHMHSDVHPEHRVNRDHPAVDLRTGSSVTWSAPCAHCAPHFP